MTRLLLIVGVLLLLWWVLRRNGGASPRLRRASRTLGIPVGASREEILRAHRQLMAREHPDAGGSDERAAQINAARDLLLRELDRSSSR